MGFRQLLTPTYILISAKHYSLKDQPVNSILIFIFIFIFKLLKEKGPKSQAFRILSVILIVLTLIGLLAHLMQTSTDSTNKFSFKGAGVVYRRRYTFGSKINLSDKNLVVKKFTNSSSTNQTLSFGKEKRLLLTFPNKTVFYEKIENSSIGTEENRDLRILASFECSGSLPSAFKKYISSTFISEYERSYADFSTENTTISTPNLTDVQINCVLGQPCQTLFQYDKQRGLNQPYPKENIFVGSDKIHPRKNVFYCCPSTDNFTNQMIVKECKTAKPIIQGSTFRESRKPFLLEMVNSSHDIFSSYFLIRF